MSGRARELSIISAAASGSAFTAWYKSNDPYSRFFRDFCEKKTKIKTTALIYLLMYFCLGKKQFNAIP